MDSILKIVRGAVKLLGADGTTIGNNGNRLKVENDLIPQLKDGMGQQVATLVHSVFNSIVTRDKQPEYWNEATTGSGASTYNSNTRQVDLTVGTASGDSVTRQTYRRFLYLTGHEMRFSFTGIFPSAKANLQVEIGPHADTNGVFIRQSGLTHSLVVRNNSSGSVVETAIDRANWTDKLDGTGESGITVDFTKKNLFEFRYVWQGVGSVQFFMLHNEKMVLFHTMRFVNALTTSYMATPNLPFRIKIQNTGTTASASTFSHSCTTVATTGVGVPTRVLRSVNSQITPKSIPNTLTPLIAIRTNPSFAGAILKLISTAIYCTGNNDIHYRIIINGTLTGASWVNNSGFAQYDVSATAITGGTVIDSGYVRASTSTTTQLSSFEGLDNQIGEDIAGNPTIITLCAQSLGSNAPCYGVIDYKEV